MKRSEKSIKNIKTALCCQVIGFFVSFLSRYIFIKTLGSEYLGVSGLFTNILSVLTLTELGVGEAIIFSLYKPLAENNEYKIKMLMQLYKKIYTIIGFTIFVLGLILTPFLSFFIKDATSVSNINLIYILFVINTSISYFFSFKKNLIIADQKKYITTLYRYGFYIGLSIIQVVYLILFKNYIWFLVLQILSTFLENYFISRKANRLYPYLNSKEKCKLDVESKKQIVKNTKAMMMHKVGGVVVNSTDNILLSSFVSVVSVGLYSNYYLIISSLNTVFSQIFSSIVASVGNLCATSSNEKQYDVYKKILFVNFWLYFFSSISLAVLFNPFIEIWIGSNYLFDINIVYVLSLNFYFTGMRKVSLIFREASGFFYVDRWKAVLESLVNLVFSIILVMYFGIVGVFLGTLISTVCVSAWIEPFVLYKYAFKVRFREFLKKYLLYFVITLTVAIIIIVICNCLCFNVYLNFIIKALICLIIPNALLLIMFKNTKEFKYFKNMFIDKFFKKVFKKIVMFIL